MDLPHYSLYIDGQFAEAEGHAKFETINPYTRKPWATVSSASEADVNRAVAAARKTFNTSWRKTNGVTRGRLMLRLAELLEANADRMALLETTDNGKVIRETRAQMLFAARQYRFFGGYADKLWGSQIPLDNRDVFDYVTREPLGVVALITAWNSPIGLLANKLAPALAAGNCAVIKPSEHASVTTLEFCKLVEEAGFPPGVVNVVTGAGETGRALVNQAVDKISFTGSAAVGAQIAMAAGKNLVPVVLELGGKSPHIIFEDADFDKALVGALAGIFAAAGQTCVAGSRLLVQRGISARLTNALKERAAKIKLGDPSDPVTEMGTAANEAQFRKILDFIEQAKKDGAHVAAGGCEAKSVGNGTGYFIEPTILTGVTNQMFVAREEIFGPVLSILEFDTEEEALAIANDTPYGLAAGVWTQNISRALRMTRELNAGQVWVNTYRQLAVQIPFGGMKKSGFGREKGEAALDEYLARKNVMINFSSQADDPFAIRM